MKVFTNTLPKATAALLDDLQKVPSIGKFYLTGGTALSLQLGHRESEDLDFFNQDEFDPQDLQSELINLGTLESIEISKGTLNLFLKNVKLQFLHYPYSLLKKPQEWNGIALSSVIDIACTKLLTVAARGSKKDFIDIAIILKKMSLRELLKQLDKKYKDISYNQIHILKSLIYFKDADDQPMPKMHISIDWEEVKVKIIKEVKSLQL